MGFFGYYPKRLHIKTRDGHYNIIYALKAWPTKEQVTGVPDLSKALPTKSHAWATHQEAKQTLSEVPLCKILARLPTVLLAAPLLLLLLLLPPRLLLLLLLLLLRLLQSCSGKWEVKLQFSNPFRPWGLNSPASRCCFVMDLPYLSLAMLWACSLLLRC